MKNSDGSQSTKRQNCPEEPSPCLYCNLTFCVFARCETVNSEDDCLLLNTPESCCQRSGLRFLNALLDKIRICIPACLEQNIKRSVRCNQVDFLWHRPVIAAQSASLCATGICNFVAKGSQHPLSPHRPRRQPHRVVYSDNSFKLNYNLRRLNRWLPDPTPSFVLLGKIHQQLTSTALATLLIFIFPVLYNSVTCSRLQQEPTGNSRRISLL